MMQRTVITMNLQFDTDTPALEIMLIWLAYTVWQLRRIVNRARYELAMFWLDLKEAAIFTGKVFTIILVSWAWALGVKI